ncbi:MAG: TIGR03943 family protein [Chloroflexota bacterium]
MKRYIQAAIILSTGFFLLSRLVTGTLFFYINQRFTWLILLAIAGFALVGFGYAFGKNEGHDHHHHHDDEDCDHEHDHHHSHNLSWVSMLIVAAPVILGFLVPPQPLGASAMENREVNLGAVSGISLPGNSETIQLKEGKEKDIMEWLQAFQRSTNEAEFVGEEAHVIGFVYRDGRFEDYPDTFMTSRFALSCCVADATAIGLITEWPDAVTMDKDQWVEVKGHFKMGEFYGQQIPILVAESITPTDTPDQPYLYYY